jgi:TatD DNase family protein
MLLVDTHAHLYMEHFDDDRPEVIRRAVARGVQFMLIPNIDKDSIKPMLELTRNFPEHCFPMIGLHPTSVKGDFREHLEAVSHWLAKEKFYAIGEIGIDLYWDKTFLPEQEEAFRFQVGLAKKAGLPAVIHSRQSFNELFAILDHEAGPDLTGVFHCFSGTLEQANHAIALGFKLGIGGVLMHKNSGLDKIVEAIEMEHFVLETDAPFISPVPQISKRNESAFVYYVAEKMARIRHMEIEDVAAITTQNALNLFNLAPEPEL